LLAAWGVAGKYTLFTELVGREATLEANSLVNSVGSATVILGPALAGVLVALVGTGPLIGLDAASFAVLGVVAWRQPRSAIAAATGSPVDAGKAGGGLRLLRRHQLMGLLVLTWIFFFLYGPVEVALPLHVSQDLHRGAGLLGLYWAFFGVGAFLGSLATGLLRRFAIWPATLVITAAWGLCLIPFAFDLPVAVTLCSLALGGLIYGPFIPLTYSLFQSRVAAHEQAAVLAARGALVIVASPLGTAFGGPITAALGPADTLAASGVATVLLAVLTAAGGLYRRRRSGSGSS
jgi:predicted MFS family arabinose efflux permease